MCQQFLDWETLQDQKGGEKKRNSASSTKNFKKKKEEERWKRDLQIKRDLKDI